MNFNLILQAFLLGIGLAMDAFAVSMTNGLKDKNMTLKKTMIIAFSFAAFQCFMPLIGYFLGYSIIKYIEKYIPYIAFFILLYIGIKMIIEGVKKDDDIEGFKILTFKILMLQSIATSIDALTVGFSLSDLSILQMIVSAIIIGIVTFALCLISVKLGKKFGIILKDKATIVGGIVLIIVGLNILLQNLF